MVDKETFYDVDSIEKEVKQDQVVPAHNKTPFTLKNTQGERTMADIVTGTVSGFVNNVPEATNATLNDVRREASEHTSEIVKEGLKGDYSTLSAIKDSRFETVSRVENNADRIERAVGDTHKDAMDRFFTLGRESADNRAQILALGFQVRDGFAQSAAQTEVATLKNTIEGQKNTQYLSDRIGAEGEKTRALIESLKNADLNRMLVERNAALVEAESERRHWRHHADVNQSQGQWAALQSQLQAFQSQLQETRQGMINFGTMAGVGQSSTSNNVR